MSKRKEKREKREKEAKENTQSGGNSLKESISRLEVGLQEEEQFGNKRAADAIRRVIECLKRKEKES